jgi:hypothetical protein
MPLRGVKIVWLPDRLVGTSSIGLWKKGVHLGGQSWLCGFLRHAVLDVVHGVLMLDVFSKCVVELQLVVPQCYLEESHSYCSLLNRGGCDRGRKMKIEILSRGTVLRYLDRYFCTHCRPRWNL